MDSATLDGHLREIFMVNKNGECELPGADDNTPRKQLEARFAGRFARGANSLENLATAVFGDKAVRSKNKGGRTAIDMLHRALGGAQGPALLGLQAPQGQRSRGLGAVKHLIDAFAPVAKQGGEVPSENPARIRLNKKQRESVEQMIIFFRSDAARGCWGAGQLQAAATNLEAVLQQSGAPVPTAAAPLSSDAAASAAAASSSSASPAYADAAPVSSDLAFSAPFSASVPPEVASASVATAQPAEVIPADAPGPVYTPVAVALSSGHYTPQELQHYLDRARVSERLCEALGAQVRWRVDDHLPPVPPINLEAKELSSAGRSLVQTMLSLRAWIETDRDIQAVANALGVQVHVHDHSSTVDFKPAGRDAVLHEVNVLRGDGHYQVRLVENGIDKVIDKFSRGDCFYGSVAIGCNYRRLREVVQVHQAEDAVRLRQIFEHEYPGQCPRGSLDEMFHAYGDLAIQEVRQRSAAALIQISVEQPAVSDAEREEQEMVLRALAEGSVQEVRDSKKIAAETAHSFHRSAPHAAFKNAMEALVHIAYMEEQFLDSGSPEDIHERERLKVEKRDLQAVLFDTCGDISVARRSEIATEMAALYSRPLPAELMQMIGS